MSVVWETAKVSRKDMKRPDRVLRLLRQIMASVRANLKYWPTVGVIVVLAIAAVLLFQYIGVP